MRATARLRRKDKLNFDADDDDMQLGNLPKEITDALISYERVAVPVFEKLLLRSNDAGSNDGFEPHWDLGCDMAFDAPQDFHLELLPNADGGDGDGDGDGDGEERELEGLSRASREARRNKKWRGQQGALLGTVRDSVGSVLLRRTATTTTTSGGGGGNLYRIPSHDAKSAVTLGTGSITAEHSTASTSTSSEWDKLDDDEPTNPSLLNPFEELRPTRTRTSIGKFGQRVSAKAARRAEKAPRKTASAGNLSGGGNVSDKQKTIGRRVQTDYHGIMGPDFIF